MQWFPGLVAACGAQRGSHGLWGGSHRVCGAHQAPRVVVAVVATDWQGSTGPVPSQSCWWSFGAAAAQTRRLGRPGMLSVMLRGEKCPWEGR